MQKEIELSFFWFLFKEISKTVKVFLFCWDKKKSANIYNHINANNLFNFEKTTKSDLYARVFRIFILVMRGYSSVLCSVVRGHSVFVQPFVKLPRCLLSYDISVRLVHVWIQTSSPAISCLLNSGQLRNLDKGPHRGQGSRNFLFFRQTWEPKIESKKGIRYVTTFEIL